MPLISSLLAASSASSASLSFVSPRELTISRIVNGRKQLEIELKKCEIEIAYLLEKQQYVQQPQSSKRKSTTQPRIKSRRNPTEPVLNARFTINARVHSYKIVIELFTLLTNHDGCRVNETLMVSR